VKSNQLDIISKAMIDELEEVCINKPKLKKIALTSLQNAEEFSGTLLEESLKNLIRKAVKSHED
jgi:hypothetical protein